VARLPFHASLYRGSHKDPNQAASLESPSSKPPALLAKVDVSLLAATDFAFSHESYLFSQPDNPILGSQRDGINLLHMNLIWLANPDSWERHQRPLHSPYYSNDFQQLFHTRGSLTRIELPPASRAVVEQPSPIIDFLNAL
jgi:hypothetical protein